MGERPYQRTGEQNWELRFCRTCNARERVIVRGMCVVCGNDPATLFNEVEATEQPTHHHRITVEKGGEWEMVDWIVLAGLTIITLYILWSVSRWPI